MSSASVASQTIAALPIPAIVSVVGVDPAQIRVVGAVRELHHLGSWKHAGHCGAHGSGGEKPSRSSAGSRQSLDLCCQTTTALDSIRIGRPPGRVELSRPAKLQLVLPVRCGCHHRIVECGDRLIHPPRVLERVCRPTQRPQPQRRFTRLSRTLEAVRSAIGVEAHQSLTELKLQLRSERWVRRLRARPLQEPGCRFQGTGASRVGGGTSKPRHDQPVTGWLALSGMNRNSCWLRAIRGQHFGRAPMVLAALPRR
jgi:hypothetical protein